MNPNHVYSKVQTPLEDLWMFSTFSAHTHGSHRGCVCVGVCVLVTQSYPTLCDPMDCSPSGSSVHGILQTRIVEGVAIIFSRRSFQPGIEPEFLTSPALAGRFFTTSSTWEAQINALVLVAQLCPTFCDPMGYSLPGSSVHGILQTRILEWVAIPFSRISA